MSKEIPYKIYLEESEMPQAWYNLRADMKEKPAPLLDPKTHAPATIDMLSQVFCRELAEQITEIAAAQPLHTVIPYRNIRKRDYPKNKPVEVYHT